MTTTTERRAKILGPEDIKAIVHAISEHQLNCKFEEISPEDLKEAILFYKNFNSVMQDSKRTIWKTFLALAVAGICGLIVAGAVVKAKGGDMTLP